MIPLSLFLLACAAIYVGTIQAAFSALLRVQLRLIAEGSAQGPELDRYLQDPLRLFLPLRSVLGLIEGFTVLLMARMIGISNVPSLGLLAISMIAFGAVCEFLFPFLIVARDPGRVLAVLLPSFRLLSRPLEPITLGLIHLINQRKRDRVVPVSNPDDEAGSEGGAHDAVAQAADEQHETHQEERKLLK